MTRSSRSCAEPPQKLGDWCSVSWAGGVLRCPRWQGQLLLVSCLLVSTWAHDKGTSSSAASTHRYRTGPGRNSMRIPSLIFDVFYRVSRSPTRGFQDTTAQQNTPEPGGDLMWGSDWTPPTSFPFLQPQGLKSSIESVQQPILSLQEPGPLSAPSTRTTRRPAKRGLADVLAQDIAISGLVFGKKDYTPKDEWNGVINNMVSQIFGGGDTLPPKSGSRDEDVVHKLVPSDNLGLHGATELQLGSLGNWNWFQKEAIPVTAPRSGTSAAKVSSSIPALSGNILSSPGFSVTSRAGDLSSLLLPINIESGNESRTEGSVSLSSKHAVTSLMSSVSRMQSLPYYDGRVEVSSKKMDAERITSLSIDNVQRLPPLPDVPEVWTLGLNHSSDMSWGSLSFPFQLGHMGVGSTDTPLHERETLSSASKSASSFEMINKEIQISDLSWKGQVHPESLTTPVTSLHISRLTGSSGYRLGLGEIPVTVSTQHSSITARNWAVLGSAESGTVPSVTKSSPDRLSEHFPDTQTPALNISNLTILEEELLNQGHAIQAGAAELITHFTSSTEMETSRSSIPLPTNGISTGTRRPATVASSLGPGTSSTHQMKRYFTEGLVEQISSALVKSTTPGTSSQAGEIEQILMGEHGISGQVTITHAGAVVDHTAPSYPSTLSMSYHLTMLHAAASQPTTSESSTGRMTHDLSERLPGSPIPVSSTLSPAVSPSTQLLFEMHDEMQDELLLDTRSLSIITDFVTSQPSPEMASSNQNTEESERLSPIYVKRITSAQIPSHTLSVHPTELSSTAFLSSSSGPAVSGDTVSRDEKVPTVSEEVSYFLTRSLKADTIQPRLEVTGSPATQEWESPTSGEAAQAFNDTDVFLDPPAEGVFSSATPGKGQPLSFSHSTVGSTVLSSAGKHVGLQQGTLNPIQDHLTSTYGSPKSTSLFTGPTTGLVTQTATSVRTASSTRALKSISVKAVTSRPVTSTPVASSRSSAFSSTQPKAERKGTTKGLSSIPAKTSDPPVHMTPSPLTRTEVTSARDQVTVTPSHVPKGTSSVTLRLSSLSHKVWTEPTVHFLLTSSGKQSLIPEPNDPATQGVTREHSETDAAPLTPTSAEHLVVSESDDPLAEMRLTFPPTTAPSVIIMPLNFRLTGVTYTDQLQNTSAIEYRRLEREVKLTMSKIFLKYRREFLQSNIEQFLKGSVLVQQHILFRNQFPVPSSSDIVRTVVSDVYGRNRSYFGWKIDAFSVESNGYTLKNLEPESLSVSFLVLQVGVVAVSQTREESQRLLESLRQEVIRSVNLSFPVRSFSIANVRDLRGDLEVKGYLNLDTLVQSDVRAVLQTLQFFVNRSVDLSSVTVDG
ncbi:uncharacterized protein LOC142469189 [Ascaphus truei]|uniref:uncharacterized protein LOC142469189 n=1 Tax=Ascaphus truei TaxID=8439 RepID=UPI003F5984BF